MNANKFAVKADEGLFIETLASLSWAELLAYFQNRPLAKHYSLTKGAAKHVLTAETILLNEFNFNNEKHQLGVDFDWHSNPSKDLEWLILLHKFYYLKDLAGAYDYTQDERYAKKWLDLIDTWISQVPDGFIDSQVTGRRLQQWLLSYSTFVQQWQSPYVTPEFFERLIRSIASQTYYLCRHLTPEGNHRTLELYAIFLVAVTFPELRLAQWFLDFSKQELIKNIKRDLLADGVHRELSTDYHHTVLKNYLRFRDLALANNIELPDDCETLLKKALEFSCNVHKPDGFIPAINDGDCNSYLPLLKKANGYYRDAFLQFVLSKGGEGNAPEQRSRGFTESGYYILRSAWQSKPYEEAHYLFFDCAPLGFGSHGHYDALNIEVAAFGQSLIVDPGRFTYSEISAEGINWRKYFKGTSAHNTVVVDGLDQMPYRCERPIAPEPQTELLQFVSTTGFDFLQGQVASHQYPVLHERSILFLLPEYWIISDRLLAEDKHQYDLYFHLASRAQEQTSVVNGAGSIVIQSPNLLLAQAKVTDIKVKLELGYVSPEYGIKQPAPIVKFTKPEASKAVFTTVLYPFKGEPPSIEVIGLAVHKHDRLCEETEATAVQITVNSGSDCFKDYYFINYEETAAEYTFAKLKCIAKMLLIRVNQAEEIINFQALGFQYLAYGTSVLLSQLDSISTVNYQDKTLVLIDPITGKQVTKTEVDFGSHEVLCLSRA